MMSRMPILFTDIELTKESVLEYTLDDPDLCKYYDYVKRKLIIDPDDGGFYEIYYDNMHDVLPVNMVGFYAGLHLDKYVVDKYREDVLNMHRWFFTFIKRLLKKSNVWYSDIDFDFIPIDSSGMKIIEVDVNDRLSKIDTMDHFDYKYDVYYKFVDRESQKE